MELVPLSFPQGAWPGVVQRSFIKPRHANWQFQAWHEQLYLTTTAAAPPVSMVKTRKTGISGTAAVPS